MITIFLMGGLGNQLFQIATVISHCIKHKLQFIFPYSEELPVGVTRPTYWDTLLKNLKRFTTYGNKTITNDYLFQLIRYNETFSTYKELPANLENCMLHGYFQSHKYIDENKEHILEIMGIKNERTIIREEMSEWIFPGEPSISIHFRLGDYKEKQQYHPVMPYQYYENAMRIIPLEYIERANILYFCEEEDSEIVQPIIDKLKANFPIKKIRKIDHTIPDWKQLLIMSWYQINIIANSSYSWWAAYINDDLKKTVIYPDVWFGPAMQSDVSDMFPDTWVETSTTKHTE